MERFASNGKPIKQLTDGGLFGGEGIDIPQFSPVYRDEDASSFLGSLLPFLQQLGCVPIDQWLKSHPYTGLDEEEFYLDELLEFLCQLNDTRVEDWLIGHHPFSAHALSKALMSAYAESDEENAKETLALLGSLPL